MASRVNRRQIVSWSLYDWANSAFATTVMAGFFPLFFKEYWNAGVDPTVSTLRLGIANSAGSLVVLALAPVLGAVADWGGSRKRFLLFFAALGVCATAGLYAVGEGGWAAAAALYATGLVGFAAGNIFYDALLVGVAGEDRVDLVSALGYALGYLGGGLLFAANVAMALYPSWFGLEDSAAGVRASFLTVALWWAVFGVPLFLFVPEGGPRRRLSPVGAVVGGFRRLATTFREVRRLKVVILFLVGYWLYIDGVDTIIRMAVDYGLALGLSSQALITALLVTQFVGFPAAIAFGWLGQRLGPKTGIYLALAVYVGVTVWAYFMDSEAEFFGMAVTIGLVQGGVQSLSRSFYTRIIPPSKAGEFFGFYNMMGKFAAVVGPVAMGWVAVATGEPRNAIFAITVLLVAGAGCLYLVDEDKGRREARVLEGL
ncbi:MAG: MFS transporter [Deferrisomatales bacterium]|nr:MFS transporter [Deferrisomatales bacterium]